MNARIILRADEGSIVDKHTTWLDWAVELQAIAQAGLAYGRDDFDIERFGRVREIAAEMVARGAEMPVNEVRALFCAEAGYQTPKIDVRAAVFEGDGILLVQERDGRWALPGGWADVGLSLAENVVKEAREEAGLEVVPRRVIALQDRAKRNVPRFIHSVCVAFIECEAVGGAFQENIETTASGYFPLDALPPLCEPKTSEAQVRLCFEAHGDPCWTTQLD